MAAKRVVETVDPYSLSPGNTPAASPLSDSSPGEPRFHSPVVEDEKIVSCSRLPKLPQSSIPVWSFNEDEEDVEIVQVVKTQLPAPVQIPAEDQPEGLAPPTYKTFIKRKSQLVLSTEALQEKLKEEASKPDPVIEKKEEPTSSSAQDDEVKHSEPKQPEDNSSHSITTIKEASEYSVLSIKQRTHQKLSSSDQLIQMVKERERIRKEELAKREEKRKQWRSLRSGRVDSSDNSTENSQTSPRNTETTQPTTQPAPSEDSTTSIQEIPKLPEVQEEPVIIESPKQAPHQETKPQLEDMQVTEKPISPVATEPPAVQPQDPIEAPTTSSDSPKEPLSTEPTSSPASQEGTPTEHIPSQAAPAETKKTVKKVIKKKPSVILPNSESPSASPPPSNTNSPKVKKVIKAVSVTKALGSPTSSSQPHPLSQDSAIPKTDSSTVMESPKASSGSSKPPVVVKKVIKVKAAGSKTSSAPQKMET